MTRSFLSIALVLTLLPAAPPLHASPQERPAPRAADPEVVEARVKDLETTFRKKDVAGKVRAMNDSIEVLDTQVIKLIGRGLKDKDVRVVEASLDCLRAMRHPESLDQLHDAMKRNKAIQENEQLQLKLIKAVGAHGDVSSIDYLTKKMFANPSMRTVEARILALGKIRDPKAVETLFGVMKSGARQRIQPQMENFRMSLAVLTGVDQGKSQDAWIAWWNDNKKTYTVSSEPPEMPRKMQADWNRFWGERGPTERAKQRSKRGGDPERG